MSATTFSSVISRSVWFCPVAGLPWLSANTTSTLAPPRPASPAFLGQREIAEFRMRVVDNVHRDFDRAHLACTTPALAALPLSGIDRADLRPGLVLRRSVARRQQPK